MNRQGVEISQRLVAAGSMQVAAILVCCGAETALRYPSKYVGLVLDELVAHGALGDAKRRLHNLLRGKDKRVSIIFQAAPRGRSQEQ